MLYQLSYEATDVGSRSIVGSYVPVKEMSVKDLIITLIIINTPNIVGHSGDFGGDNGGDNDDDDD